MKEFIEESNIPFENWYVGITGDEEERNTKNRGIDLDDQENYNSWETSSREIACHVEKTMIEKLKTQGGRPCNGGNEDTTIVYAFNTNSFTVESITESLNPK